MNFPRHDIGLMLYHNDFKSVNTNAKSYIANWEEEEDGDAPFKTPETRQRAIDSNEVWELHWAARDASRIYIGLAPTIEELLIYCEKAEEDLSAKAAPISALRLLTDLVPHHEHLELIHNPQRFFDQTVKEHFRQENLINGNVLQFETALCRDEMVDTNEMWQMSWAYANGQRMAVAAPTLDQVLNFSLQVDGWAKERRRTAMLKNIPR